MRKGGKEVFREGESERGATRGGGHTATRGGGHTEVVCEAARDCSARQPSVEHAVEGARERAGEAAAVDAEVARIDADGVVLHPHPEWPEVRERQRVEAATRAARVGAWGRGQSMDERARLGNAEMKLCSPWPWYSRDNKTWRTYSM